MTSKLRRLLLPAAAFCAVFGAHLAWTTWFPEQDPAQAGWLTLPAEAPRWWSYFETQRAWLGYSYALSAAFGVTAVRVFLQRRTCTTAAAAAGGLTLTGTLAATGCFLIGCCGSPMLAVWISVFGVGFLPLAGPLLAALTTVTVLAAWWWLTRRQKRAADAGGDPIDKCPTCVPRGSRL